MITEDYVSFETAKLLKDKGFDEPCVKKVTRGAIPDVLVIEASEESYYPQPTLQMAMKWLREVHKIFMYTAYAAFEEKWSSRIYTKTKHQKDLDDFNTYEEACEAAIKYCLENLI